jgi:hypothetical protein
LSLLTWLKKLKWGKGDKNNFRNCLQQSRIPPSRPISKGADKEIAASQSK